MGPRPPCVLVVDDEPANVALLERLIHVAGIEDVHGLTDPRDAVRRCVELQADLVLLDLHMPHVDGFEVLSALRDAFPEDAFVPVIVLTADTSTQTRDRALEAGAKDFITKPFDRNEVVLRVRSLLETRALYLEVQRHAAALRADLDLRAQHDRRLAEEYRLRVERVDAALSANALRMVFQPILDVASGELVGVEALARFACEPLRPPNEWFDDAASVGMGSELECAAVRAALTKFNRLPRRCFMSVNVSAATAIHPDLAEELAGAPADRVVLELTEHTVIDDYGRLLDALTAFRDRGVRVAVDDAGAGYSGLRHILNLRPDIIKLDIGLTSGIHADPARRALGAGLVVFAREINAVIIAEGVEQAAELDTLRDLAVPWAQGYHLGRPGPLPDAW